MNFTNITNKINWRIIVVHIVATFFIIFATKQFAQLNDIELIKLVDKYGVENSIKQLKNDPNSPSRIAYYLFWNGASNLIGLIIAFLISLIICIQKKVFWLNGLIVFIVGLIFNKLGLLNGHTISRIFFSFYELFPHAAVQCKFFINGTILFLTAIFIFFNKWTNNLTLNSMLTKDS
ncbi:hypothetical protein [Flavobacterium limi]|uniref:Uncharacterized protein n=1 Tax=Flavobacterium limi TaxID=2045105 RepID=A0ABQ1TYV6_9FLAO|nr:hypothetical protein [Flavobacterium limi]GGF07271.1 hypothetical protein GCM10011518_15640 [Flavobacterium limi]